MASTLFDLSGRSALITGSSRGIGKAVALGFAAHGANVVISARPQEMAEADATVAEINSSNGRDAAIAHACNIANKQSLQALVDAANAAFGRIDILVCNAASNPFFGPMEELPDDAFVTVLQNNVVAAHWLIQMVAPQMKARRDGAILVTASIGGLRGGTVVGAYQISKAADMQLVRNLALELGPYNVRVNAIAPGLVKTQFARALWEDAKSRAREEARVPLGRIGEPEDIAGMAILLASRAGAWVTGQTFVIDGGATA
jgi:NAD(P)-dependent dehydrogenase (short-subunit alcohol dehydrogenase family)